MKTCERPECTNTLTNPRNKYCSRSCSSLANYAKRTQWVLPVEYSDTKRCTACDQDLPLVRFGSAGRKNDPTRLRATCKECTANYNKRPEVIERKKLNYKPEDQRLKNVERHYNITPSKYLEMLEAQNQSCAICLVPFGGKTYPHVDHDHSCCPTKARSCGLCVRALLCSNCNTGVGLFKDNEQLLQAASQYLLTHRSEHLN